MALADAAAWLVAVATQPESCVLATLETTIDLVVPEFPVMMLESEGCVVRLGRSLTAVRSRVVAIGPDDLRAVVGLFQGTMIRAQ